ncbi:MAG: DUF2326 domain-containing protein [Rhizobiales bacterium]|nr:DUF2326 domain-containing protein [Hyphomicrobiales bacterium]
MIKLSKLYCNKPDIFPDIEFNDGLNIIYAAASKKTVDKNTHSHSVGKTTLLEIIDYLFIKTVKKGFFLKDHVELFAGYNFYLEIKVSEQLFVTIKRVVNGKISIATYAEESDCRHFSDDAWDYTDLGVDTARLRVDEMFKLDVLSENKTNYRKGLRYCFRRQGEYNDTFKVNSSRETDSSWKPYLGGLLGIDSSLILSKLSTNERITKLGSIIDEIRGLSDTSSQAVEAEIQVATARFSELKAQVDSFDFNLVDQEDVKNLVYNLDEQISELTNELYTSEHQMKSIDESLGASFDFDLNSVKDLFDEISLHLPEQLIRNYDELLELNKNLTKDRNKRLLKTKKLLVKKREKLNADLTDLHSKRGILARELLDERAFSRFKSLQSRVGREEANLAVLNEKLIKLDTTFELKADLDDAVLKQQVLANKISAVARQSHNETLKSIGKIFSDLVKKATELDAFLYVDINKNGNPEFHSKLHDHSSKDKGESYRQIISGCFDLSLLTYYSSRGFYRFAYHDGLLESLDDRLKMKVLKLWHDEGIRHGLQLIISLHDSDIPLSADGTKITLEENLIARKLHDRGNDGRLFKMEAF